MHYRKLWVGLSLAMLLVAMSRQMMKPLPKSLAKLRLSVAAESNFSTGHSLQRWLDFANLSDLSVPLEVPLESLTNGLTTSAEMLPSGAFNQPLVEVNNVSVSKVSQVYQVSQVSQ